MTKETKAQYLAALKALEALPTKDKNAVDAWPTIWNISNPLAEQGVKVPR